MIEPFATVLERYIERDGRRVRQLSQATVQQFSQYDGVAHNTISRWVRGESKKPRSWQDVVKLATVLRLSADEADTLLISAGHPMLDSLRADSDSAESYLFEQWPIPPPDHTAPPFQAPPSAPIFLGRDQAQQRLHRALLNTPRRCCLQGMGGVGKTTLAIQAAYALRDSFPDGVLWLQLRQFDPSSALQAIASAYGHDLGGLFDLHSRSTKVREILATKQTLLILDDAVSDGEIRPLLPPTNACAVLITTRSHDLAVADDGVRITLEPFEPTASYSLKLFEHELGPASDRRANATRATLADELGHLPLALDIAAKRIKHEGRWSVDTFLEKLRSAETPRLPMLKRGDRALSRTIGLSYEALPPTMQQVFGQLAIFEGADFSSHIAADILGIAHADMQAMLAQLHALSLLQARHDNRYVLHALVQDFSAALETCTEHIPAFVRTFLILVTRHKENFAQLDVEQVHLFRALDLAYDHGLHDDFIDGAVALFPYLRTRGRFDLAEAWLTKAEQLARDSAQPHRLANVLYCLGRVSVKLGRPDQAEQQYEEALARAESADDDTLMLSILVKMGALAHYRSNFANSIHFYEEALPLAQSQSDVLNLTRIHTNLGLAAAVDGRLNDAESFYAAAQSYAEQHDNVETKIALLQSQGQLYANRANYEAALACYREGLDLIDEQKAPEMACRLRSHLGLIACELGHYTEATQHFKIGLQFAQQIGTPLEIYRQRANLGRVAMLRHQFDDANFHYAESLAMARKLNYPTDITVILTRWGMGLLEQKKFSEADVQFAEARALVDAHHIRNWEPLVLFGQAQVAAARQDFVTARQLGEESEALFIQLKKPKATEVRSWLETLEG